VDRRKSAQTGWRKLNQSFYGHRKSETYRIHFYLLNLFLCIVYVKVRDEMALEGITPYEENIPVADIGNNLDCYTPQ